MLEGLISDFKLFQYICSGQNGFSIGSRAQSVWSDLRLSSKADAIWCTDQGHACKLAQPTFRSVHTACVVSSANSIQIQKPTADSGSLMHIW